MPFDTNLMLRPASDGDLDASEQARAGVDFGAGDVRPLTYIAIVPAQTGTSPTLDLKVQESDDNSSWKDFLTFRQITVKGRYAVTGTSDARYRRLYATTGGTTPNFGAVVVGVDVVGEYQTY